MNSFYGGRQGASFVIVKRFDGIDIPDHSKYKIGWFAKDLEGYFYVPLIERTASNYDTYPAWGSVPRDGYTRVISRMGISSDPLPIEYAEGMKQCFQKGGSTTSAVGYGEYVIIDTISGVGEYGNPDNGKVFRRGINYNDELGGAEYIGNVTGPRGDKGDTGPQGLQGNTGTTPNIVVNSTNDSLSSDNPVVTVSKSGTQETPVFTFNFSGFKGSKGDTGNIGPEGPEGPQGIQGIQGDPGRDITNISMSGAGKTHVITATYSDGTSETVGTIYDGADGQGSGNMSTETYDPEGHGYVDAAASITNGTNSLDYDDVVALSELDIDDLQNVNISNPTIGQVIKYNGTGWYNGDDSASTGDMQKADYDANDLVKNAGGIPAYVAAHSGGSGDMHQSDYDDDETVKNAGGIAAYVASAVPEEQVQSDWNQNTNTAPDFIKNKPFLAAVASSGSYLDLLNQPTIPTRTSELINDSGFINSLPVATRNSLGIIQVGNNLTIDENGVLSAVGGGGGGGGGGGSATYYIQSLEQGETEVTFENLPTTGDYLANIYTSNGTDYVHLDSSVEGQVTLTYTEQNQDITVYLRLEEVTT